MSTKYRECRDGSLDRYGLEVRRTSRGWSLFRRDERLSPLGRSMPETWRRARRLHPELPEDPTLLDKEPLPAVRFGARRLLAQADGQDGVRADIAILLAKKLAPTTRLGARMRRRPTAAEWRLARRMQRVMKRGDVPDAAFELAIQEVRRASSR